METLRTLQTLVGGLAQHGDRPAIVALHQQGSAIWSYARLAEHTGQFARRLLGQGLVPGDRIAIVARNRPEWFAACLGVVQAGGMVVPLDVQFADDMLAGVLADCRPRWLVTATDEAARLEQLDLEEPPRFVLLDGGADDERGWQRLPGEDDQNFHAAAPDDPAVLFYTSGTTGPPKGVPLTHRNLVHQLNYLATQELVITGDRVLLPLPLHHVYPFALGMLLPCYVGIPIVLPAALTGPQIVRALTEAEVTAIIGVPRLYRSLSEGIQAQMAALGWPGRPLLRGALGLSIWLRRRWGVRCGRWLLRPLHRRFGPRLRVLASGGSPLDTDLAYWLEGVGWPIAIGYGLTETSPLLTLNPPGGARLGSVGVPIAGLDIRLAAVSRPGADQEEVPIQPGDAGDVGEIQVRGPSVFSGYYHAPEKTAEAFTDDGWFRTGDLGRFDDDRFLYLSGRVSTLIVTEGGENIQPDQLEAAYEQHPSIREIGVLQRDHRLVAVVVPEAEAMQPQSQDEVHEMVQQAIEERARHLPSYQRLAHVLISREALARTRLGKIRRHKLEEHYDRAQAQAEGTAAETGPIAVEAMSDRDQALLEAPAARQTWQWLAGRYPDRRLTPDTGLQLDLGIDSLAWLNLSLDLQRHTGIELTEAAMSRIQTVRDLLHAVVAASRADGEAPCADPLEDPDAALSAEQRALLRPLSPGMRLLARLLHGCVWILMRLYFRLHVEGREHLPEQGQYIVTPNHLSFTDPLAVAAALDYTTLAGMHWAGMADIMLANPCIRLVSRLAGVIPIEPSRAALSSLAAGAAVLKRGHNLVWFPEGMRSRTGRLQRFQPGIGLLVDRCNVPVVPVWLTGTYEALAPGRFWPRPARICVRIGRLLTPDQLRREGKGDEPHQRITQALRRRMLALSGQGTSTPPACHDREAGRA
jgi:long-chain acyl-CoA synthetase